VKALAIDTSTDVLALAAVNGSARVSLVLRKGLQHSPSLMPLVDRLLAELDLAAGDLELIGCSVGPGSFTGIRIGLATAKGICLARSTPLVGVTTLDALARPFAFHEGDLFAVLDARKGNLYAAAYRGATRTSDYLDIPPGELRAMLSRADRPLLVSPDREKILAMVFPPGSAGDAPLPSSSALVDPLALLELALESFERHGAPPAGPQPLYLRRSEAEIVSGRNP
jgi:tRNA threonylcarbamoyladenosine biosynthesis protein TsaB